MLRSRRSAVRAEAKNQKPLSTNKVPEQVRLRVSEEMTVHKETFATAMLNLPRQIKRLSILSGNFLHHRIKLVLGLESNARSIRHAHETVFHGNSISKAVEGSEHHWIGFIPAQA